MRTFVFPMNTALRIGRIWTRRYLQLWNAHSVGYGRLHVCWKARHSAVFQALIRWHDFLRVDEKNCFMYNCAIVIFPWFDQRSMVWACKLIVNWWPVHLPSDHPKQTNSYMLVFLHFWMTIVLILQALFNIKVQWAHSCKPLLKSST